MTIRERIAKVEAERHTPDNVIPFRKPERRTTARWLEWTRENEQRGKDLSGYIGGGNAA